MIRHNSEGTGKTIVNHVINYFSIFLFILEIPIPIYIYFRNIISKIKKIQFVHRFLLLLYQSLTDIKFRRKNKKTKCKK